MTQEQIKQMIEQKLKEVGWLAKDEFENLSDEEKENKSYYQKA